MKNRRYRSQLVGGAAIALALVFPCCTAVAQQEGGVPGLNVRVTGLEGRVTAAEGTLHEHEATLQQHANQLADHAHRLTVLESTPVSATISFGGWSAGKVGAVNSLNGPTDRHQINSPNGANVHRLNPLEVTIQTGGSVNFIIAGGHQVGIYEPGATPASVLANQVNGTATPIDSPTGRLYRGLDNSQLNWLSPVTALPVPATPTTVATQTGATAGTMEILRIPDRTEVVYFPSPGRYLVACLVRPHLLPNQGGPGMFGWVNVVDPVPAQ